jgi:excisionase family DNA binding protein
MSHRVNVAAHRLYMNRQSQTLNANSPEHRLLDIAGLAERLAVSERFVRRLIAERRVPFFKVGKFIRFDSNDIDQWIENRRVV